MKKANLVNTLKQSTRLCIILLISIFTFGTTDAQAQCPTLTVSPDVTICAGSSTVLTASGSAMYNWGPARGLSSTTRRTVTASPTVTTTYTVTGRTGFGCVSRKTVKVTVKARPSLSVVGERAICAGSSTTLTASGAATYTWGPATGLNKTTGATVIANPTTSTTYTVIGTNTEGCTRTQLVRIRVNQTPEITVNGILTVCKGNSTTLTAMGASTYVWSPATGLSSTTGATVVSNPTVTTTYTVTGTTVAGCVSKTTVTVTASNGPTISITGKTIVCAGEVTELTAAGATTYLWAASNAITTISGATILAAPIETTTFTVVGTDAAGCSGTGTIKVTVNPRPIITVSGNTSNCSGSPIQLTASGGVNYTWGPSAGLSATTGATVVATPTVATTYTVSGTNDAGCTGVAVVNVVPSANPIITVVGNTTICNGGSTQLTAAGAATFSWSPATGLSSSTGTAVTATPTVTTTYTVTGTTLAGCVGKTVVTVTVNSGSSSPIAITGNTSICQGVSTDLTASGAANFVWSTATGVLNTAANLIATPTVTTTYTVSGTDANGCNASSIVTINVNPNPIITISGNRTICVGSSTTLTASGASQYTWGPSTGLNTTTGATVIATPTVTSTYTVSGTNDAGCTGFTIVTVVVTPNVVITVTGPTTICNGNSAQLTAAGADTYTWSMATGLSSTTGATVTATPTVTTTYTVTGTTSNGCVGTATTTVVVGTAPALNVGGNTTVCAGESTDLTASGAAGFVWSTATGIVNTAATLITTPTVTTTYTVTATDAVGCAANSIITVIVNALPKIEVTGNPTVCAGATTTLIASGANNFTWTPGAGLSATTGAIASLTPTVSTTFTVTGTNDAGCIGSTIVNTILAPLPIINISVPTTLCNGTIAELIASGAETFNWTPAQGLSATTGAIASLVPTVGTTYTVTGTSLEGCIGVTTFTTTVNPRPIIDIVANATTICQGEATQLTASGAANFVWGQVSSAVNTATGTTLLASPEQTTTYTVAGTDANGCVSVDSILVLVNKLPKIELSGFTTICPGTSTTLTASGAPNFTWTPADGISATTGVVATFSPTVTTTYTLVATSLEGCVSNIIKTIEIAPRPEVTVIAPSTICSGEAAQLIASGAATFQWIGGNGLSATTGEVVNAISTATNTATSITYTVIGTVTAGCVDTQTVTIQTLPLPKISLSGNTTICLGGTVDLTASGATNFAWNAATSAFNTLTGNTIKISPTESTTFTVSGTNQNGCIGIDTISITVNQPPVITTSPDVTICGGTTVTLSASGATNFVWGPGSGLSTTVGSSILATPLNTTTYTVSGTGANGCNGSATVKVTVDCANAKSLTLSTASSEIIINGGQIAPNPTSGYISITPITGTDKTIITITDALGRLIAEVKANDNTSAIELDLSNESDGIYFVKLVNGSNVQYNKIIKQ